MIGDHRAAAWHRALLVVLVGLLTAAVAHSAAGGGVPGPGGWLVTACALLPVAAACSRLLGGGAVGLTTAGVLGQGVAHVVLSVVSTPSPGTAVASVDGCHVHGAAGVPATVGGGVVTGGDGSGWHVVTHALGHLLHMAPAMAAAHALAALGTALLVGLVCEGLRRVAIRFTLLLRRLLCPSTPWPASRPRRTAHRPLSAWSVDAFPLRGPPLLA